LQLLESDKTTLYLHPTHGQLAEQRRPLASRQRRNLSRLSVMLRPHPCCETWFVIGSNLLSRLSAPIFRPKREPSISVTMSGYAMRRTYSIPWLTTVSRQAILIIPSTAKERGRLRALSAEFVNMPSQPAHETRGLGAPSGPAIPVSWPPCMNFQIEARSRGSMPG